MSDNLKNDILQVVQSSKQNVAPNNDIKATELRPPQKSIFSKQIPKFRAPQVSYESKEDES